MCRYDDKDNTWEPEENLDCPGLIAAFETERAAQKEREKNKRKAANDPVPAKKKSSDEKKCLGFDRGLAAEKIIGATDSPGN